MIPFEYEPFGFITNTGWVSVVFEDGIAPVWKNEKFGFILYLNREQITLDVPAQIKNGRTLVPVRAISESLGVKVDWDDTTKTVILQN